MRCSFCNTRVRGDFVEVRKSSGGRIYFHHAEEGPHRNCSAAARHRGELLGVRPTLYTDKPTEEVRGA